MALTIVYIVAGLIVLLLIYAAMRPKTLRVERSLAMNSAAETIFQQIEDFHKWSAWSPWEKMDPAMTRSFSGRDSGIGAVYEWEGNKKVGKGRMEITDVTAPTRVIIKLDFLQPFESHNTTEFTIDTQGGKSVVKWSMFGPSNYMSRLMGIFMNMDKMIGNDFERGLAAMKVVVEG